MAIIEHAVMSAGNEGLFDGDNYEVGFEFIELE